MFGTPRSFAPPDYLHLNGFDPSAATPLGDGFSLTPVSPSMPQPVSNSAFDNQPRAMVRPRPQSLGMFATSAAPGMASINAALARNAQLGQERSAHRKKVMGDIGNAVAAGLNGYLAALGNPAGIEGLREMHERRLQQQKDAADLALQQRKLMQPRIEQVGNSLGYLDPSAGTFDPIYRDPQAFEAYASSLGFQPGSPEYIKAIQDYRLGSYSDPAIANRAELEGVRFGYRDTLQDHRFDRSDQQLERRLEQSDTNNRRTTHQSDINNQRSTGVSSGNNIRSTSQSDTNSRRSAETARGAYSYTHGRGHRASGGDEAVAVGPDGKRYVVRNGQWVPLN
jgi:hypothetical protein